MQSENILDANDDFFSSWVCFYLAVPCIMNRWSLMFLLLLAPMLESDMFLSMSTQKSPYINLSRIFFRTVRMNIPLSLFKSNLEPHLNIVVMLLRVMKRGTYWWDLMPLNKCRIANLRSEPAHSFLKSS